MGRPREHDETTRARLLRVAGELVEAEGVEGLSLRRLARRADTTTRAIYSLFESKEGLLAAMYHEMAAAMAAHHEAVPVSEEVTEELLALALAYRASALLHPTLYPLLVLKGGAPLPEDVALARRGFERVVETFARGVRAGVFRRGAESMGRQLFALVHGLTTCELAGMLGARPKRAWREAVSAMLRGFAA